MTKAFRFALPLIVGAAGIIWLALTRGRLESFGAGVAAIILHWYFTRNETDEETADSSYFLGFLLTLVLLVFGLSQLGQAAKDNSVANVAEFLLDLALGLGLTVVGLTVRQLRIFKTGSAPLNGDDLLRKDIALLVESQAQLAANIDSLRGALSGSILGEALGGTTRVLDQAQEAAADIGAKINASTQAMDKAVRDLEKTVRAATTRIDTTAANAFTEITRGQELLRSHVDNALVNMDSERAHIEESLRQSNATAEKAQKEIGRALLEQVDAWRNEMEGIKGQLLDLHDRTNEEFSRGLASVSEATRSFTALSDDVVQKMAELPDPSVRLENLWEGIQRLETLLGQNARNAAGELQSIASGADAARTAIGSLAQSATTAASGINSGGREAATALRTELAQIDALLEQFHRSLETHVRRAGNR